MAIVLNHTIVRSRDKEASAQFFADIFGLKVEPDVGHFAAVRVNDTLTLDFADCSVLESHHYAFHVSDVEQIHRHFHYQDSIVKCPIAEYCDRERSIASNSSFAI